MNSQESEKMDAVSKNAENNPAQENSSADEKNSYPAIPEDALIIIPVRNMVLFPGMVVPITIAREKSLAAAQAAMRGDRQIGVVLQKNPETADPKLDDLYPVGTVGNILRYVATSSDAHHVVCQGEGRFRLKEILDGYPFLVARVEEIQGEPEDNAEIQARLLQLKQKALEVLQLIPEVPQ